MKKAILYTLLLFSGFVTAQPNLVPNGDFEEYNNCPILGEGLLGEVKYWLGGDGGGYYNACANIFPVGRFGYNEGVPQNVIGYQNARSGYAYIGLNFASAFYLYNTGLFNAYTYVKLNLNSFARLNYKCTFFLSASGLSGYVYKSIHGNFRMGDDSIMLCTTSSIGAYLGNTPLVIDGSLHVLPAQIKNNANRNLNDTVNWMEISGIFEANGTEQYMTIGTFEDSASITYFNSYGYTKTHSGILGKEFLYFLDDVSLIPQNTTHYYDTLLCSNAPLQLEAVAQADSFEWNDGNKKDKIRNFTNAGLVWVKSWLYGGTVYMWDSLNIIPNNINSGLPKDTFLCNEQTQLNISTTNANAGATYLWNNGSIGKSLVLNNINWVNGKAQVWLTTTANYCTQTDTVTIYQKPALQIPINDTTTCFEDVPQILLDAGATFKSYLWLPTGETSKTVYSNQAQIYKLTVTDSFNCSASKNIIVDELCKAEIFLPNAFTPNGDGKNETYKPILKTKNLLQYQLKIYDSWGTEVFSTTDPNQTWDAKNKLQGVYVVTVNYQYKNFAPSIAKGTVTVLR